MYDMSNPYHLWIDPEYNGGYNQALYEELDPPSYDVSINHISRTPEWRMIDPEYRRGYFDALNRQR